MPSPSFGVTSFQHKTVDPKTELSHVQTLVHGELNHDSPWDPHKRFRMARMGSRRGMAVTGFSASKIYRSLHEN